MAVDIPLPDEIAKLPADGGVKYNRLIHEKSPYLLQHAANPVDWYPWSDEAFALAEQSDRPVFLSVGYATCHWCHVMERESFEDEQVAEMLNEHFVCIKVDREERPDVDHVYMAFTQAITGLAGWPMTVVMTPDRKPFFAGTYFPRQGGYGRMGMIELIPRIGRLWREQRDRLIDNAKQIMQKVAGYSPLRTDNGMTGEILTSACRQLAETYDEAFGGFGSTTKFPSPHILMFLLRYWKRTGDGHALAMAEKTLTAMRLGGMYDHIGFGFHRYSTDRNWRLPHFEKMLYDQALLVIAYIEAFQATGRTWYASIAREVLEYILRDMTSPEGAFYSAEDADSEGVEGRFYLWNIDEIKTVLGEGEGRLFIKLFNLAPGGNYHGQATGPPTGLNILHLNATPEILAAELGMASIDLESRINEMRARLFMVREQRERPLRDDKILTDWNGLMIAALATAGRTLNESRYIDAAAQAADFILTRLRCDGGRLLKRYRHGEAAMTAHLDDYAFMVWAAIEMYESAFEMKYLRAAVDLTDLMLELFWDDDDKGFFLSAEQDQLPMRGKAIYDGALPSGNSVAAVNLLRLYHMTGRKTYQAKAHAMLKAFSALLAHNGPGCCHLLMAMDFMLGPVNELVISATPGSDDIDQMLSVIRKPLCPNKVVLFRPACESSPEISELANHTLSKTATDDRATVFLCRDFTCLSPTTDPEVVRKALEIDCYEINR